MVKNTKIKWFGNKNKKDKFYKLSVNDTKLPMLEYYTIKQNIKQNLIATIYIKNLFDAVHFFVNDTIYKVTGDCLINNTVPGYCLLKDNKGYLIDKNGVKTKTTIGKICDFAKKSTASIKIGRVGKGKVNNPSEKTVWVQNQRHEPQLKGLILLGTAYDYFVRDFFDCRYNPQNKANVIETLLRLYGPSSSNKVDITSFDSWYIHVFERDRVGRFNRSRFNFTDKLFELYETTDQDKMVILNHWI